MRRLLVTVALAVGLLRAAATAQAASIVRYEICLLYTSPSPRD